MEIPFFIPNKFAFGSKFMARIRLLYSSPQTSVRTNNSQSDHLPLQRSTRQGCPLSPLLFALAIEPLAITLRSNPLIKDIVRYTDTNTNCLYMQIIYYYTHPTFLSLFLLPLPLLHRSVTYQGLSKIELMPLIMATKNSPLHNI